MAGNFSSYAASMAQQKVGQAFSKLTKHGPSLQPIKDSIRKLAQSPLALDAWNKTLGTAKQFISLGLVCNAYSQASNAYTHMESKGELSVRPMVDMALGALVIGREIASALTIMHNRGRAVPTTQAPATLAAVNNAFLHPVVSGALALAQGSNGDIYGALASAAALASPAAQSKAEDYLKNSLNIHPIEAELASSLLVSTAATSASALSLASSIGVPAKDYSVQPASNLTQSVQSIGTTFAGLGFIALLSDPQNPQIMPTVLLLGNTSQAAAGLVLLALFPTTASAQDYSSAQVYPVFNSTQSQNTTLTQQANIDQPFTSPLFQAPEGVMLAPQGFPTGSALAVSIPQFNETRTETTLATVTHTHQTVSIELGGLLVYSNPSTGNTTSVQIPTEFTKLDFNGRVICVGSNSKVLCLDTDLNITQQINITADTSIKPAGPLRGTPNPRITFNDFLLTDTHLILSNTTRYTAAHFVKSLNYLTVIPLDPNSPDSSFKLNSKTVTSYLGITPVPLVSSMLSKSDSHLVFTRGNTLYLYPQSGLNSTTTATTIQSSLDGIKALAVSDSHIAVLGTGPGPVACNPQSPPFSIYLEVFQITGAQPVSLGTLSVPNSVFENFGNPISLRIQGSSLLISERIGDTLVTKTLPLNQAQIVFTPRNVGESLFTIKGVSLLDGSSQDAMVSVLASSPDNSLPIPTGTTPGIQVDLSNSESQALPSASVNQTFTLRLFSENGEPLACPPVLPPGFECVLALNHTLSERSGVNQVLFRDIGKITLQEGCIRLPNGDQVPFSGHLLAASNTYYGLGWTDRAEYSPLGSSPWSISTAIPNSCTYTSTGSTCLPPDQLIGLALTTEAFHETIRHPNGAKTITTGSLSSLGQPWADFSYPASPINPSMDTHNYLLGIASDSKTEFILTQPGLPPTPSRTEYPVQSPMTDGRILLSLGSKLAFRLDRAVVNGTLENSFGQLFNTSDPLAPTVLHNATSLHPYFSPLGPDFKIALQGTTLHAMGNGVRNEYALGILIQGTPTQSGNYSFTLGNKPFVLPVLTLPKPELKSSSTAEAQMYSSTLGSTVQVQTYSSTQEPGPSSTLLPFSEDKTDPKATESSSPSAGTVVGGVVAVAVGAAVIYKSVDTLKKCRNKNAVTPAPLHNVTTSPEVEMVGV